jgi:hypothetical protein
MTDPYQPTTRNDILVWAWVGINLPTAVSKNNQRKGLNMVFQVQKMISAEDDVHRRSMYPTTTKHGPTPLGAADCRRVKAL